MDKKKREEQRKIWDKIAPSWNSYRQQISPTILSFLEGKKGKILDDGCGSGRNFVNLEGLEWYGTDFSKEMSNFAKENAKKKRMNVKLVRADSTKLPFDDSFFDYVVCFALLHCVDSAEKRKKSLEEIYRVLKKGGEALISAWGRKSGRLKTKNKEDFIPWTRRHGEVVTKVLRYNYIFDLDELKKLSENVGFIVENAWEERNVNLIVRKG